jgi:predicted P-loop ATPase
MQHHGIMVNKAIVGEAVQTAARNHRFHPIREYFEGLTWDGISRIGDWLTLYLGVDPSDYARAVGAKWLIGAVARVFQPGCKMDCCIVLEGPQGIRKSSALRVLAEPWFCDEIADLGSKDSSMQVHGVLVVEIAELDALQKSEVSKVKVFMSRSTDRYRPPYAKYLVEAPRESVFAGSVNPGIKYLKDETGGRRFWPVTCGRIDIKSLERDRDQLWAEAVVRFRANSTWWLDTPELNQAAEQEQAQRYDVDPWLPKIVEYIKDLDSVSIRDVLEDCLFVPTDRWSKADKNRVAATLRFLGWTDRQAGPRGHRERRYYPPAA